MKDLYARAANFYIFKLTLDRQLKQLSSVVFFLQERIIGACAACEKLKKKE
jgi:hypothetical protein